MKKGIVLLSLLSSLLLTGAEPDSAPGFKPIELLNIDFSVPSENKPVGWALQNPAYPGEFSVESEAGTSDQYLAITPLPNKRNEPNRALIFNITPFKAAIGDKIRLSCQVRSPQRGFLGVFLLRQAQCQWSIWKAAVTPEWQTVQKEWVIKSTPDALNGEDYYFGFDVFENSVLLKNIKISIQRQSKKSGTGE